MDWEGSIRGGPRPSIEPHPSQSKASNPSEQSPAPLARARVTSPERGGTNLMGGSEGLEQSSLLLLEGI